MGFLRIWTSDKIGTFPGFVLSKGFRTLRTAFYRKLSVCPDLSQDHEEQ